MEVRKKVSPDYEGNARGSKIITFLFLIFPTQVMSKECVEIQIAHFWSKCPVSVKFKRKNCDI